MANLYSRAGCSWFEVHPLPASWLGCTCLWWVFSTKRCQRMTSVRRLRVAQVHLCSDTLGALRGFCGCLLLGEPWVPEHVRCLRWNHAKDSQDVPCSIYWEVSWEVSDMLLSLKIQYQYKCSFCWRVSYENDLGKRFASTASFPEGASEIFGGLLPFVVTEHLSWTNIDDFFLATSQVASNDG